ncbi:MAG: serine/threonine-protein kinase [Vulcanimicrobiota bacterium]
MRFWLLWLLSGWVWAEPLVHVDLIPPEATFSVRHSSGEAMPGGPNPAARLPSGTEFLARPLRGERGLIVAAGREGYEDFERNYPLAQGKTGWNGSGWTITIELRPLGLWNQFVHNFRFHPAGICLGLGLVALMLGYALRRRHPQPIAPPEDHYQSDLLGRQVDCYLIEERLGEGAYAQVFLARHREFGDVFALKILRPYLAEGAGLQRIARELDIGRRLKHPSLVRIVGFGTYRETPYLVMDFVRGETLAGRLSRGAVPLEQAVDLLTRICEGVEYAHAQGVIHRDLKPDNIMLTPDGGVKVLDFGVARPGGDWATLTSTGQAIGTPAYMAPEQLLGQAGPASDLYALGVILFVMIRGSLPFSGEDVVAAHLSEPAPNLDSPLEWLNRLCAAMLEKSVSRRIASAGAVLQVLRTNQVPTSPLSEATAITSQQRNP